MRNALRIVLCCATGLAVTLFPAAAQAQANGDRCVVVMTRTDPGDMHW